MPPRKPLEPDEQPECRADETTEITVPIEPGTSTTIEIPPGTTHLSITIDPSLQSSSRPEGFAAGLMRGCGCVAVTVFGALAVLIVIGSLIAR